MKKRIKKSTKEWITLAFLYSTWLIPFVFSNDTTQEIEENQTQIKTEAFAEHELAEIKINKNTYFDVPLSHELQEFIFYECEEKEIDPAIVISIIAQESNYKTHAIGDNGESIGLMQIQTKWHKERMQRLVCHDLLDPFQNVKVGIDYIYELIQENPDLHFVLMAYNGGRNYAYERIDSGNISDYAIEVIERSQQLERIGG